MFDIQLELKKLPQSPGVYIMKDDEGTVIYVGKAKSLKNRVRQYFQPSTQDDPKTLGILSMIESFEIIVTDTELEALILECNLIKKYKPRYNTLLKDDKTYPYIKLTVNEEYPRMIITRKYEKDHGRYFGPFAGGAFETVELLAELWPLRLCKGNMKPTKVRRACLNHHIGKCPGPCQGSISKEDYLKRVAAIESFLSGHQSAIVRDLETQMEEAAENLEFERAAKIRDRLTALRRLNQKQGMLKDNDNDCDIIATASKEGSEDCLVLVFSIREGKMTGQERFTMKSRGESPADILGEFIKQHYPNLPHIPRELVIQSEIPDVEMVGRWLSEKKGRRVYITVPKQGEKRRLVQMAIKNAELFVNENMSRAEAQAKKEKSGLSELMEILGLPELPERIEAYDISNTQGFQSVGSMVVYENGKPARNHYRKFKIRSVIGANDVASMEEVLRRRLARLTEGDDKFAVKPGLIMIDGGTPQVNKALEVVADMNFDIAVCGLVKDDKHRTRGLIYNGEEIIPESNSEAFKLITRIQNEVHRFAVEYHRKLREKTMVASQLDNIPGIGGKRTAELLAYFKGVEGIKTASIEALSAVPSMNKRSAQAVYDFFHQ